eukprot:m.44671 g.44671  ORF g.44671 m.44671 type:complete len:75 (-) comp6207_c0_seq1:1214-1438(-)
MHSATSQQIPRLIMQQRSWAAPCHARNTRNLLRRNAMLAGDCQALMAIGSLDPRRSGVAIAGGTGWACLLFADR